MRDFASDVLEILSALPLFSGLAPEPLRELARASHTAAWQKGGTIFRAGDIPQVLFVVLSGHVKRVITSLDGGEKVIDVVASGHSFGDTELFGGRPYASYAVAVAPVVLLCVGGDSLRRAMGADAQLALRAMVDLAHRQYDMECDTATRHFHNGSERVLDYFLRLAGKDLSPLGETLLILPISKQLVAARIGITPESLSRALREFSDQGLVAVRGRQIRLDNARIAQRLGAFPDALGAGMGTYPNRRSSDPHPAALVPQWSAPAIAREVRSIGSVINMVGRQRMLSQRMAARWLLLGQGGQTRGKLDETIAEFEARMEDLALLSLAPQAAAARETLREAWLPYRALLACAPGPGGAPLIFDQSERVLAAAQRLTQTVADRAGTAEGRLIEIAGRQRMLSQRMAKFFLFGQWGLEPVRCREGLEISGEEFIATLGELLEAPLGTPRIRAELGGVARQWRLFQALLSELSGEGNKAAGTRIVSASERVLAKCDAAVSLYERLAA